MIEQCCSQPSCYSGRSGRGNWTAECDELEITQTKNAKKHADKNNFFTGCCSTRLSTRNTVSEKGHKEETK